LDAHFLFFLDRILLGSPQYLPPSLRPVPFSAGDEERATFVPSSPLLSFRLFDPF
jgi:hypothetical protein